MFDEVNTSNTAYSESTGFDSGLQKYMLNVYNHMTIAVLITALAAMITYRVPALFNLVYRTPLSFIIMLAPLFMSMYLQYKVDSLSVEKAYGIFYTYAALLGISLSYIFIVYSGYSIARTFVLSAGLFAWISLYGYTTKRDLTTFGGVLMAGLMGVMICSLINLFVRSSGFEILLSVVVLLVFVGITAYETQQIRRVYYLLPNDEAAKIKYSIVSALSLYLNFINIFLRLLYLFGDRRDR